MPRLVAAVATPLALVAMVCSADRAAEAGAPWTVESHAPAPFGSLESALGAVEPAVTGAGPLRVLPRVGNGRAVVHLLNLAYQPERDAVRPLVNVELRLDLQALGVAGSSHARVFSPESATLEVPIREGRVTVPEAGLWTLVVLDGS